MRASTEIREHRHSHKRRSYARSALGRPMPTICEGGEQQRSLRSFYKQKAAEGQVIPVPADWGSFFSGPGTSMPVRLAMYGNPASHTSIGIEEDMADEHVTGTRLLLDDELALAGEALLEALAESGDESYMCRDKLLTSLHKKGSRCGAAQDDLRIQATHDSTPPQSLKNRHHSTGQAAAEDECDFELCPSEQTAQLLIRASSCESFITASSATLTEVSDDSIAANTPTCGPIKGCALEGRQKQPAAGPGQTVQASHSLAASSPHPDKAICSEARIAEGVVSAEAKPGMLETSSLAAATSQAQTPRVAPFTLYDNAAFSPEAHNGSAEWMTSPQSKPGCIRTGSNRLGRFGSMSGDSAKEVRGPREGKGTARKLVPPSFNILLDSSDSVQQEKEEPGTQASLTTAGLSKRSPSSPVIRTRPAQIRESRRKPSYNTDLQLSKSAQAKTESSQEGRPPDPGPPSSVWEERRQLRGAVFEEVFKKRQYPDASSWQLVPLSDTARDAHETCKGEKDDDANLFAELVETTGTQGKRESTAPSHEEGEELELPTARCSTATDIITESPTIDQLASEIQRRQNTLEKLIHFYDSWVSQLDCPRLTVKVPPAQASSTSSGGLASSEQSLTSSYDDNPRSRTAYACSRSGSEFTADLSDLSAASVFSELSQTFSAGAAPADAADIRTLVMPGGGIYRGLVSSSHKPHGMGRYQSKQARAGHTGDLYQGDFVDGLMSNYGVYYFGSSKGWYSGQWIRGRQQGYGKQIFANGTMCLGNFLGGRLDGYGVCLYPTGDSYEGQFKDGIPHGKGYHKAANKGAYAGSFSGGRRCGIGVYRFSNGDTFSGTFESDHPCGQGIYVTRHRDRLEGEFSNGQAHGWGVRILQDGHMAAGKWHKGKLRWSRTIRRHAQCSEDLPDADAEGMDLAQEIARSARYTAGLADRAARAARKCTQVTDSVRFAVDAAKHADDTSKKAAMIAAS